MPGLLETRCLRGDEVPRRIPVCAGKGRRDEDDTRRRSRPCHDGLAQSGEASIRARLRRRRAASLAFFRRLIDGFI